MCNEPWYADIVNYLATGQTLSDWLNHDGHYFFARVQFFFWEESYLFKYCPDQIIRRCLPEDEHRSVLVFCHKLACGGHFGPRNTAEKVLQSGVILAYSFKDSFNFASCAKTAK